MRMFVIFAFMSALALPSAAFATEAQLATKPEVTSVTPSTTAPEAITSSDARRIAMDYLKDQDMKVARVGKVRKGEGKFHVQVMRADGIPIGTLVIDAATGKIE